MASEEFSVSSSNQDVMGRLSLDENSQKLYGRKKELDALRKAVDDPTNHIILLHGKSGSGKSALCRQLGREIPLFVSGKFDQYLPENSPPLPAFMDALDQLGLIINKQRIEGSISDEEMKVIRNSLGDEGRLLAAVSTNLASCIQGNVESVGDNLVMMSERLALAIRSFLKRIDSLGRKIVIYLDDLQWADDRSLHLLLAIADELSDVQNLVLICGYRTEMQKELDFIVEELKDRCFSFELHNLSDEQCNEMVAGVLMMKPDETAFLAEVVRRKTGGNPLAVLHFLKVLEEKEFLIFSFVEMRWTWKTEEIRTKTNITSNVVDMLTARIQQLPRKIVRILALAACTGFTFEEGLLESMYSMALIDALEQGLPQTRFSTLIPQVAGQKSGSDDIAEQETTFKMALKVAEREGLLERTSQGEKRWRFSHDRVQECVYNILPVGAARAKLHLSLGGHFQEVYGENAAPRYIFLIADQMNRASSLLETKTQDRISLIELNLRAAKAAKQLNGTDLVAKYTRKATEMCQEEDWLDIHDTLLEVYQISAEVEFASGQFQTVRDSAGVVAIRGRNIDEKVSSQVLSMQTLGAQRFFEEALADARRILLALGEPLPEATSSNVAKEVKLSKKLTKRKDDNFFSQLPMMANPRTIWAMQILHLCSIYGWNLNPNEAVLAYHRMLNMTVTKGRSPTTPCAYAGYSMLTASAGDDKTGFRFSQLASSQITHKGQIPSANLLIHAFGSHLGMPLSASLEPLLSAYRLGLEYGDIVSGSICVSATRRYI